MIRFTMKQCQILSTKIKHALKIGFNRHVLNTVPAQNTRERPC